MAQKTRTDPFDFEALLTFNISTIINRPQPRDRTWKLLSHDVGMPDSLESGVLVTQVDPLLAVQIAANTINTLLGTEYFWKIGVLEELESGIFDFGAFVRVTDLTWSGGIVESFEFLVHDPLNIIHEPSEIVHGNERFLRP